MTETQRIRELVSINREIAGIADPSEALRTLVDKAAALSNADACVLVGSSPSGASQRAIVACSVGLDSNLARGFSAPLDEDLGNRVRDGLQLGGEARFFAVPLISGRQIIGLLAVSHRPPAAMSPDDEVLLSALADRALICLELAIGNIQITDPFFEVLNRGIKKAIGHCDRVVQIGDRLLDVSQMSSGRFKPDLQDTDLSDIVRDVTDRFVDQMAHARCPLRLAIEPDVRGLWDRLRLEEVVTNLFSNAVKYAPGRPVEVELLSDSNTATLRVRDHGSGIGKDDEERIFERFERAMATQRVVGWGLGLYVCRQIIEAHGGTIQVASEPGGGATFVVQLPLSPSEGVSSEART